MKIKKTGVTEDIKKETSIDKWLLPFLLVSFLLTLITSGFNERYGWISIPLSLDIPFKIIGFIVSIIGMIILCEAQLQNSFASAILDINEDQKLIDTGLYAHVRHPYYSGGVLWVLGTPFALGYWIALVPAIITIGLFVLRIKYEEDMLVKEMDGYEEYRTRVKYKLFPKIL
jgi:protein-S-isoprenylcysteine O-methyltransferase Ste14